MKPAPDTGLLELFVGVVLGASIVWLILVGVGYALGIGWKWAQ